MFDKAAICFVLTSSLLGCSVATSNNGFSELGGSIRGAIKNVEDRINKGIPSNGVFSELGGSARGALDNIEERINN